MGQDYRKINVSYSHGKMLCHDLEPSSQPDLVKASQAETSEAVGPFMRGAHAPADSDIRPFITHARRRHKSISVSTKLSISDSGRKTELFY